MQTQSPAMPASQAIHRSLANAAAVLYATHGISHAEIDAIMAESFAAFYAGRALETPFPHRYADRLHAAMARHLDSQGIAAGRGADVDWGDLLDRYAFGATALLVAGAVAFCAWSAWLVLS